MMQDKKILQDIIALLQDYNFAENNCYDQQIYNGLYRIFNERWITIHPHGDVEDEDGKKDYRRLKLEDGESPREAIKRAYGSSQKEKNKEVTETREKIRAQVKGEFDKREYYKKLDRNASKLWQAYSKLAENNHALWTDTDEVKMEKSAVIDEAHKKYMSAADERREVAKDINNIHKERKENIKKALDQIGSINIKKALAKADIKETTKRIENALKDFDYKKLEAEREEISKQVDAERNARKKQIAEATSEAEREKLQNEYQEWYEKSEIRQKQNKISNDIIHFSSNRMKAISKALQINGGVAFKMEVDKKSVLKNKVEKANELLSGIINKDYIPDFMPVAKGRSGRGECAGNYVILEGSDTVDTHIHEVMHWLERVNPKMLANSKAFLQYRTEGEEALQLKKITNLKFNANEVAKKDNFFSPYCGKIYDDATEIMSMGVQRLFKYPEDFMKNDREYFDFVIANLQGKL